jgi:hypothetical protein
MSNENWGIICALCKQPVITLYNPVKNKKHLGGLSPQANYTDRATAACWRSYCRLLWVEGVAYSAQWISTAINLSFLDWSCYFLIQVASQLSSWGWMDPIPDPFSENLVDPIIIITINNISLLIVTYFDSWMTSAQILAEWNWLLWCIWNTTGKIIWQQILFR